VEVVRDLGEATGRLLFPLLVKKVNLDVPFFHGKAFYLRRLVTARSVLARKFSLEGWADAPTCYAVL